MQALFAQLMILFSVFSDGPAIPNVEVKYWDLTQPWKKVDNGYQLSATSKHITDQCRERPNDYLEFPSVYYASHEIFANQTRILSYSTPSFLSLESVYGSPVIKCRDILKASSITWTVNSPSNFFARFYHFPKVISSIPKSQLFNQTLNIFAAGSLFALAILSLIIFVNKVSHRLTFSFFFSCLFFSGYFAGSVPFAFLLNISVVNVNRLGDGSLWLGQIFMFYMLMIEGVVPRLLFRIISPIVGFSLFLIFFAQSVDQVQVATNICILVMYPSLTFILFRHAWRLSKMKDRTIGIFQLIALSVNVLAGLNDMAVVQGAYDGPLIYSFGVICGLLLLALGVHGHIIEAYKERNYLRENLEKEVEQKTASLQGKTHELQNAMKQLKVTQSELVQSAKLASIGTLAAGIAHEINNSLNYVNGALRPLEKQIFKEGELNNKKIRQLIDIMKEGLTLTFNIINSLKSHAGMNKSDGQIEIRDLIESVMPIVKSKMSPLHEIEFDFPEQVIVDGKMVALSQVFMNLMTNAIDAMPSGGKIKISSSRKNELVEICFSDTGMGMSPKILNRVFDPFFTTKDVGKGTGLGLHIVKSEIEKQGGSISVNSREGVGTQFHITLPGYSNDSTLKKPTNEGAA